MQVGLWELISALGIDSGRITGYPEVDRPPVLVYLDYFRLADHPGVDRFGQHYGVRIYRTRTTASRVSDIDVIRRGSLIFLGTNIKMNSPLQHPVQTDLV